MPRVAHGREAPAEDRARECLKVSHARLRVASRQDRPLVDAAGESPLPLRILTVQDRSRLDQRRSRYHQSVRLDEAEPFEMGTGVRIGSGHTSACFGTDAELFRVEQRSVFSREVTIGTRRIDSSRGIGDHLRIQEVSLQTGVIRVQQARATDHGERYDVLVVGLQNSASDEFVLALTNPRTADLAHPSAHPARFQQPAYETAITRQLFQGSATDDELPSPIVQPIPEPCPGRSPFPAEHFERNARIDYGAHQ